MALIEVSELSKVFPGGLTAVDKVDLDIQEGETLVLIGTSGSGKTTLMKMMNRLIEPSGGTIRIAGEDITGSDVIALRREIGYVIQKIGLFPHMTIEENIAVVPRLKRWPREKRRATAQKLLAMVGLEPEQYLSRWPAELSGGQQQRVGVARALAGDPPIVLMDEPFGALDPITREQLQEEFRQLKERIQKTIVFVTHDIFEAVNLGDRIAIMDEGRLLQVDTPERILTNPANEFVTQFLGKHRFQLEMSTLQVEDLMSNKPVVLLYKEAGQKAREAADLMRAEKVKSVFVVEAAGQLRGIVTAASIARETEDADIEAVLDAEIQPLAQEADLLTAMHAVASSDYDSLPVIDSRARVVGVLTAKGLAGIFLERLNSGGEGAPTQERPTEAL